MSIATIQVRDWQVNTHHAPQVFPAWATAQALCLLRQWVEVFPREETWVQRTYGVPSLFVRFDCFVVAEEQRLVTCEIEDRPGGMGVTTQLNPDFAERLAPLRAQWPPFRFVASSRPQTMRDDYLWLTEESPDTNSLVLVRAEPDEVEFHHFERRSVSTVTREGDKGYGVALGLWRKVTAATADELFDHHPNGFVLKPLHGSKCKDVEIWKPDRGHGTSTVTRIKNVLASKGPMFCQPYCPPMGSPIPGEHMIYRMNFGFSPVQRDFVPLGGMWMSRREVKIHGAGNSTCGPLVCDN